MTTGTSESDMNNISEIVFGGLTGNTWLSVCADCVIIIFYMVLKFDLLHIKGLWHSYGAYARSCSVTCTCSKM